MKKKNPPIFTLESVRKKIHHQFDALVRQVAHDDLLFSMELIGVKLEQSQAVFESVAGTRRRHDMSLVGKLEQASEAMKANYGGDFKEHIQQNHKGQLVLQIEWMTRMSNDIAWRQLLYVNAIQRQHPFFAHMTTVTLSNYEKNVFPVQQVCFSGVEDVNVEIIALPKQDPFVWICEEFPRRAVFSPALNKGRTVKALKHALEILKPILNKKNQFSLFALLRVLAELSLCTKELIMAAKETNLEIPDLPELAQEEPFLEKLAETLMFWREQGEEKGVKKGLLGLEQFNDLEALKREIRRRQNLFLTES